jgi:hypothetical protein
MSPTEVSMTGIALANASAFAMRAVIVEKDLLNATEYRGLDGEDPEPAPIAVSIA